MTSHASETTAAQLADGLESAENLCNLQAAELTGAHRQRLLTAKRAKYSQLQLQPEQLAVQLDHALQALKAAKPAGTRQHLSALQTARPLLSAGDQSSTCFANP